MPLPSSLTESFSIRETAESGRGVYANNAIAKDVLLYEASDIAARVIYRQYRREVCAQCFKYDRGRHWKLRNPLACLAYCSQQCLDQWTVEDKANEFMSAVSSIATEAIGKKGSNADSDDEDEEGHHRPTAKDISVAWDKAAEVSARILLARQSDRPTKADRRALMQALAAQPYRDIVAFLLSGSLCAAYTPELWADVLELVSEPCPYVSPFAVNMHTISYHHLLATCPPDFLPHIQADTIKMLAEKSSHNVFNIWSQDLNTNPDSSSESADTEAGGAKGGSECLGYGLWPSASYFNHSCAPNVRKQRVGRTWRFFAAREIEEGEELCITYLGGDEKEMSTEDRMARLKMFWGFDCACARCRAG